jgi:hypothetical protein
VGPELLPVVAVVAGAAVVLLVLTRVPDAPDRTLDRTSRERIDERLTEFFGPAEHSDPAHAWHTASPFGRADPRIRLWRDTSAVLMIVGIGIIGVTLVNGQQIASGGVLEATATPANPAPVASPDAPLTSAPVTSAPSPDAARTPVATPVGAGAADPSDAAVEAPQAVASQASNAPATPSPERLALVTPCPAEPDCYLYQLRSGDNLTSVATYFGVSNGELLDRNPEITDPSTVRTGKVIRLPTPRR